MEFLLLSMSAKLFFLIKKKLISPQETKFYHPSKSFCTWPALGNSYLFFSKAAWLNLISVSFCLVFNGKSPFMIQS